MSKMDTIQDNLNWINRNRMKGDDLNLEDIKNDLFLVLDTAPNEVSGLLEALREGRIEGSTYDGECCCLVGTIANIRGCIWERLENNHRRPIEQWFFHIDAGDTPEDCIIASQTAEWIEEWMAIHEGKNDCILS